jgi:hypothetical protein
VHVRIINGESTDKIRANCYAYLRELYKKKLVDEVRQNTIPSSKTVIDVQQEVVTDGDSNLRPCLDRRPSQTRL